MSIKTGYCLSLQTTLKQSVNSARDHFLCPIKESQLLSHAQGKKHQNVVKGTGKSTSVLGFLKKEEGASISKQSEELSACKETEELSATVTRSNEEQKSSTMAKFAPTKGQHKAEILWALKSVMSHFSYNSAHDITDVFKAMFPYSSIAQHMSCSPTKLSYMISFGIASYFIELLLA